MTYRDKRIAQAFPPGPTPLSAQYGWRDIGPAQRADTEPLSAMDCMHLVSPDVHLSTPKGEVRADRLVPGDVLVTRSFGPQAVLGIMPVVLARAALISQPRLTPIRIAAGALATALPLRNLIVAPDTCFVGLDGAADTATVPAMDLVGEPQIARVYPDGAMYLRIILPLAVEIMAEGVWFSPGQTGPEAATDDAMAWPVSSWQRLAAVTAALLAQSQPRPS